MTLDSLVGEARRFLFQRRTAYVQTFSGPVAEEVLIDLARFCRAHTTTFHADPRVAAMLDGRREVWIRIQQHLQLSDADVWRLMGRPDLDTNQ